MIALRAQGFSLSEIAARYEISRERVRQILRAHDTPASEDVARARRRRVQAHAEMRIDELLALWRAGETAVNAARALGLSGVACRSVIECCASDVDRAARRASLSDARRRHAPLTYREADILDGLSAVAARLGHVPNPGEYDVLALEFGLASVATVLMQIGDWPTAIRAAAMAPRASARRGRDRRWTAEACWAALRQVVAGSGVIPTVLAYERYAAGREDVPSAATVRNRLGRWSVIATRLAAERELAALHQPLAAQPRGST